ncbi:MAG: YSC84-related protein [Gammaproteobacteria bacterium]|jgi:lipid-binding SYLF domain-containing protein|nr:YSC84-related protein [Gammaproteobacteria bacterium]
MLDARFAVPRFPLRLRQSLAWALVILLVAAGWAEAAGRQEKQDEIRAMAKRTLERLYFAQPTARGVVERAAGYAVFSNFGMKIFVAGGGSGDGVAVNNKSGAETFMKMAEIQAGLGFGIKEFRVVFVFETEQALGRFVESGWELGGEATAAAQISGMGDAYAGAYSVSPGVWMYQLTDTGLSLQLTVKGTKYWKNPDLN